MLIVKLLGGLGNQMFEYALGRRLAIETQHELRFDFRFLDGSTITSTPRNLGLNAFPNLNPRLVAASAEDLALCDKFQSSTPYKIYNRARKLLALTPAFARSTDHHSLEIKPGFLQTNGHLAYVDGLWQNEYWFADVASAVREEFVFPSFASSSASAQASQLAATNSVSLHIRRGDYLTEAEAAQYASVCSLDYYEQAVAKVAALAGANIEVYVFSDDIVWAEQHLKLPYPCVFMANPPEKPAHEDMHLMSLCKHHIIANSTYSWWGAWLGTNPHKAIVAPKMWFPKIKLSSDKMVPADWIKL